MNILVKEENRTKKNLLINWRRSIARFLRFIIPIEYQNRTKQTTVKYRFQNSIFSIGCLQTKNETNHVLDIRSKRVEKRRWQDVSFFFRLLFLCSLFEDVSVHQQQGVSFLLLNVYRKEIRERYRNYNLITRNIGKISLLLFVSKLRILVLSYVCKSSQLLHVGLGIKIKFYFYLIVEILGFFKRFISYSFFFVPHVCGY